MIDPTQMTKYDLSVPELEEVVLFCVSVAGKNAITTAICLEKFKYKIANEVGRTNSDLCMFEDIRKFGDCNRLSSLLRSCGFGCYNQRAKTFISLANSQLDLQTCTAEELEVISGIGLKTSRFFLVHTRRKVESAILDVHVLKYLQDQGEDVPSITPSSKKQYAAVEKIYQKYRRQSNMSNAEFDLWIWNQYSKHLSKRRESGFIEI